MKIVPSEFSNSAWNYFIFAKEIAYKNPQQNVDSDNLYIGDTLHKIFLKANDIKNTLNDVVISTEHLVYGFTYDKNIDFKS